MLERYKKFGGLSKIKEEKKEEKKEDSQKRDTGRIRDPNTRSTGPEKKEEKKVSTDWVKIT